MFYFNHSAALTNKQGKVGTINKCFALTFFNLRAFEVTYLKYLVSSCSYILIFGGFQKFKDNCNPVYEETLEYEGQLREMTRTLEVQVVSKKTFAPNPILGMVRLTVSRLS